MTKKEVGMSNKQNRDLNRSIALAFTVAVMMATMVFVWLPQTNFGRIYAASETGTVVADVLNVRSGPGTGYSRIGSLKNGKTFSVTDSANDSSGTTWYKMTYGSRTGYVSSKYVTLDQSFDSDSEKLNGTVNDGPLRVRSGPGTNYGILGTYSKGKTVTIVGKTKNTAGSWWYKINYNGKTGYLYSGYVTATAVESASTSSEAVNLTGTVNDGPLRVRSGPGTNYGILGTYSKGKTVTIVAKETNSAGSLWYKISYNGKAGYLYSQYVTVKETATSTDTEAKTDSQSSSSSSSSSSASTQTQTTLTGTVNDGPLRIRSGPGTNYKILGQYSKGKTVTIEGKETNSAGNLWYKITYNGKTGYLYSQYVTVKETTTSTDSSAKTDTQSSSSTQTQTQTQTQTKLTGVVNDGPLRIRSGPGTNYKILGQYSKGKSVTIEGKETNSAGNLWYKITYNGKTGYLYSQYVTVNAESVTPDTSGDSAEEKTAEVITFQLGTTTADEGLNVRKGPGTNYGRISLLSKGTSVTIIGSEKASNGKLWYKYQYSASQVGYICSDYVTVKTVSSDSEFEAYMTAQGFPESYKPGLRMLHAAHPTWTFKALKLDYSWSSALSKETAKPGTNLVSSSSPVSYRSTASGAYNSSTGAWTKYDGSWYAASPTVVAYYMDPRNFLSEEGIYQFMTHKYDASTQNESTVSAVISGSFMEGKNPGGGYSSYTSLLNTAGKNTGVNPNVLAAMIIQEQGWNGSSLVSGTYSGYEGYYNFFNIGAYTTSTMNAIQRGLWYAQQQGWDTPYKAIVGGAQFYANNYVNSNQDSYYTKKFNVKNGLSSVATHQYMTNVSGAATEGSIVKRAFNNNKTCPVAFEIPVYQNMPESACQLP